MFLQNRPTTSFSLLTTGQRFGCVLLTALAVVGCGKDEGNALPWDEQTVVYHAPDGTSEQVTFSDNCGDLGKNACSTIQDECGDRGAADVFVDENGEVLEVICFPPSGDTDAVVVLADGSEPPVIDNKDVIVLVGDEDTPAIVGDLELDGNNVTLYGDDPATSILDGSLSVTKNNALVTGITITGDVHVTFNNAVFSNCVILGNLTLEGNNAKIAGCRIEGDVTIIGNNNEITATEVGGTFSDEGENTCVANEYIGEGELICD